jgi:hypothetical protein
MNPNLKRKSGSTLVESCLAIIMLSLILFGILQVSLLIAANDVVNYAAMAGARCSAIGYDDRAIAQAVRVAALPGMGAKPTMSVEGEILLIKDYLRSGSEDALSYISDEFWSSLSWADRSGADYAEVEVVQDYPFKFPMYRAFTDKDTIPLRSMDDAYMENHADLNLW